MGGHVPDDPTVLRFYLLGHIHLTCWGLPELYPRVVPKIPRGVDYVPLDGGPDKCQR